ncbi:MAG: hypothetical protein ABIG89_06295 [Candidatus Woesearchaeota archaeon]
MHKILRIFSRANRLNRPNKKAMIAYWQLMFMFVRLFVLTLVFMSMVLLVTKYINDETNIQDMEIKLFVEHLLYSDDGLSYYDEITGRLYPGILNADDFRSAQDIEIKLNKAFNYGSHPLMSAKFEFIFDEDIKNPEMLGLKEFYYNKDKYGEWDYDWRSKWNPLSMFSKQGKAQSATKKEEIINVILRKEANEKGFAKEHIYPAKLKITMLSPNS